VAAPRNELHQGALSLASRPATPAAGFTLNSILYWITNPAARCQLNHHFRISTELFATTAFLFSLLSCGYIMGMIFTLGKMSTNILFIIEVFRYKK
jgi:hypothetical protein